MLKDGGAATEAGGERARSGGDTRIPAASAADSGGGSRERRQDGATVQATGPLPGHGQSGFSVRWKV